MSKVVKHVRNLGGQESKRKHKHYTMGDTGYVPSSTDRPIKIKR